MDGLFDKLQGDSDEGGPDEGLTIPGLLELPDDLQGVVAALMRLGKGTAAQLSAQLRLDEAEVEHRLRLLVKQNVVCEVESAEGAPVYRSRIARKRRSRLADAVWDLLEDCPPEDV